MSPFATCGDRPFKCGDRKSFQKLFLVERSNKLYFLQHIYFNCGDSKEPVATKVANVTTGTFWLNSAGLNTPPGVIANIKSTSQLEALELISSCAILLILLLSHLKCVM